MNYEHWKIYTRIQMAYKIIERRTHFYLSRNRPYAFMFKGEHAYQEEASGEVDTA